MVRCGTSGLLQGVFTPLEPCIFLVRHPAVSKGPLTCEDMTGCEQVSVNPGLVDIPERCCGVVWVVQAGRGMVRGHDQPCGLRFPRFLGGLGVPRFRGAAGGRPEVSGAGAG